MPAASGNLRASRGRLIRWQELPPFPSEVKILLSPRRAIPPGILSPYRKKDPHHRRGSNFRPRRGSYPHQADFDRLRLPRRAGCACRSLSIANRGRQAQPALPGSNERDPPACTGFSATRALFPAYRKKRLPPIPSFYGRVNNLENFLCPASEGGPGFRFRDWVRAAGGASAFPARGGGATVSDLQQPSSDDRGNRAPQPEIGRVVAIHRQIAPGSVSRIY